MEENQVMSTRTVFRTEDLRADADAVEASSARDAMKRRLSEAWKGETAPATPPAAPQGDAREAMKKQMAEAWKVPK
jgi:hypothetical protein